MAGVELIILESVDVCGRSSLPTQGLFWNSMAMYSRFKNFKSVKSRILNSQMRTIAWVSLDFANRYGMVKVYLVKPFYAVPFYQDEQVFVTRAPTA